MSFCNQRASMKRAMKVVEARENNQGKDYTILYAIVSLPIEDVVDRVVADRKL